MRRWHGNPWAILITICLGFFMTLLDLTIVNIAIPNMIDGLKASLDEILWVINAYVIVMAVLVITAGRLGDLRGPRGMFIAGVVVFTLASLACGLSQNPIELIAARGVQGLGAALLMPQTLAILTTVFPPERRGAAFGVWGAVAGVATIAGPTLGGFLVTALDWRWIFFVNLPIGVLVVAMGLILIPDLRPGRRQPLDVPGVLLATASLVCLTFGLVEGTRYDWGQIWSFVSIPLVLALGVVLLAVFLLLQARRQGRQPLVPFLLFRDRNFTLMNAVAAVVSFGMIGFFLPMTIYLQSVLGFSALKAGLTLAPVSVVSMFVAPVAGRLSDRIGGKYLLLAGLLLFAGGMGWVVTIAEVGTAWYAFLPALVVAGFGVGLTFAPMSTLAMRDVEPRVAGAASGVMNTIRQLGSVLGTSAVGALLQAQLAGTLRAQALARSGELPPPARGPFVDAFSHIAHGGLEVGAGQTGGAMHVPPGTPAALVVRLHEVAQAVFTHGFVAAMKTTAILPVSVLLVGAVLCLGVRRFTRVADHQPKTAVEVGAG